MSQTSEAVYKHTIGAIVKVVRYTNKLLFYQANNLIVPQKVIITDNIKSIELFKSTAMKAYTTHFKYYNDTDSATLLWYYGICGYNWENETLKLIKDTIKLL